MSGFYAYLNKTYYQTWAKDCGEIICQKEFAAKSLFFVIAKLPDTSYQLITFDKPNEHSTAVRIDVDMKIPLTDEKEYDKLLCQIMQIIFARIGCS
jgi:hypothetical protein